MDRNHCTRSAKRRRPRTEVVGNETTARVLVTVSIKSSGTSSTRPGATIGVEASHRNAKSRSVRVNTTSPG
jgi:hypothetical protein